MVYIKIKMINRRKNIWLLGVDFVYQTRSRDVCILLYRVISTLILYNKGIRPFLVVSYMLFFIKKSRATLVIKTQIQLYNIMSIVEFHITTDLHYYYENV